MTILNLKITITKLISHHIIILNTLGNNLKHIGQVTVRNGHMDLSVANVMLLSVVDVVHMSVADRS